MAGPVLFPAVSNHRPPRTIQSSVKLLSTILLLFATVTFATATPIQPDIKKLLSAPRPTQHFAPARVGWNGPEASTAAPQVSPAVVMYGPAGLERNVQESLIRVATPDWRIFLALGALIFLLRMLRGRDVPKYAPVAYPSLVDGDLRREVRRPAA